MFPVGDRETPQWRFALDGSTEAAQFSGFTAQPSNGHGPNAACRPILGECPKPEKMMAAVNK